MTTSDHFDSLETEKFVATLKIVGGTERYGSQGAFLHAIARRFFFMCLGVCTKFDPAMLIIIHFGSRHDSSGTNGGTGSTFGGKTIKPGNSIVN